MLMMLALVDLQNYEEVKVMLLCKDVPPEKNEDASLLSDQCQNALTAQTIISSYALSTNSYPSFILIFYSPNNSTLGVRNSIVLHIYPFVKYALDCYSFAGLVRHPLMYYLKCYTQGNGKDYRWRVPHTDNIHWDSTGRRNLTPFGE